ncbi:hypothetical protein IWZ03DRAFT_44093 [Phyllosticta citriasiana]|uniref:Uncharacterized protein n=1 Tax=Phyllosticta citriasiana TaxID=595635 RepID=A0ABR1KHM9_9PEZI
MVALSNVADSSGETLIWSRRNPSRSHGPMADGISAMVIPICDTTIIRSAFRCSKRSNCSWYPNHKSRPRSRLQPLAFSRCNVVSPPRRCITGERRSFGDHENLLQITSTPCWCGADQINTTSPFKGAKIPSTPAPVLCAPPPWAATEKHHGQQDSLGMPPQANSEDCWMFRRLKSETSLQTDDESAVRRHHQKTIKSRCCSVNHDNGQNYLDLFSPGLCKGHSLHDPRAPEILRGEAANHPRGHGGQCGGSSASSNVFILSQHRIRAFRWVRSPHGSEIMASGLLLFEILHTDSRRQFAKMNVAE